MLTCFGNYAIATEEKTGYIILSDARRSMYHGLQVEVQKSKKDIAL